MVSSIALHQSNRPRPVRQPPLPPRPWQASLLFQFSLPGEASSTYASRSICDGLFLHAFLVVPTCTKPAVGLPIGVEVQRLPVRGRQHRHPAWLQEPPHTRVSDTPVPLRCFQMACPIRDSKDVPLLFFTAYPRRVRFLDPLFFIAILVSTANGGSSTILTRWYLEESVTINPPPTVLAVNTEHPDRISTPSTGGIYGSWYLTCAPSFRSIQIIVSFRRKSTWNGVAGIPYLMKCNYAARS